MKGPLGKIRISRKLVLIVGGVVVLCGGTGAAAVFIGTEALLGPSYQTLNGLSCTEVKTVKIHKADRFWIRKYVTTEPTDGMSRVKTALRVATAVYATEKPDLVQVVVLDKKGPENRSDMRGRAVGADVIFIADPSKVPEETGAPVYTARYVDKPANENGQFYGEKINIPISEIEQLVAKLDDRTECVKPELPAGEGHGAPAAPGAEAPSAHGEAAAGDGHGAPADDVHGEVPVAEGHGEAPAADGHGAPAAADAHGQPIPDAAGAESSGWLASLKGMVLGAPAAPAAEVAPGEPAGRDAPARHDIAAPAIHGAEAPAGHGGAPAGQGIDVPVAAAHPQTPAPGEAASAAPQKSAVSETEAAERGGWFSSLKGMVMGPPEAPAVTVERHDAAPAEDAAQLPANHDAAAPDAAVPAAGGEAKKSDDFGNAWLAKLRATPVKVVPDPNVAHGNDAPAEDEGVLPPKSVLPKPDAHAAPTR